MSEPERELGQLHPAYLFFQTSLRINNEFCHPLNKGETQFELGLLERERGNNGAALEQFAMAADCFRTVGSADQLNRALSEMEQERKRTG